MNPKTASNLIQAFAEDSILVEYELEHLKRLVVELTSAPKPKTLKKEIWDKLKNAVSGNGIKSITISNSIDESLKVDIERE